MFKCKIADLVFLIDNKLPYTENAAKGYICDDSNKVDISLCVTDEEIDYESKCGHFSRGVLEFTALYRKLCNEVAKYNCFLMHSALISIDGEGVAFLAPSGTGKSTHILNWKKAFSDRVRIINGDKPLIKISDEKILAFGTPWCGKEKWNLNESVELTTLAFIERDEKNHVREISSAEALPLLMQQLLIPEGEEDLIRLLDNVNELLSRCKLYKIYCNTDEQSALISYNAIKGNI